MSDPKCAACCPVPAFSMASPMRSIRRRSQAETALDRFTRWYLKLRDSRWLGWAAFLLRHGWAFAVTAAGIAVVAATAAASWWLLAPAADWLAHHDVGSASGPLLQTARDSARGRLLTGAGLFAAGVLVYTARTFALSRQGQVTDRYTKAIAQIGDEKREVRVGGIYALERIARDSQRDHPTVMEVLAAFVREYSPRKAPPSKPGRWPGRWPGKPQQPRQPVPADVQAALTVLARRFVTRDKQPIDLTGADLTGARWPGPRTGPAGLGTRRPYWPADPGRQGPRIGEAARPGPGPEVTRTRVISEGTAARNIRHARVTLAAWLPGKAMLPAAGRPAPSELASEPAPFTGTCWK